MKDELVRAWRSAKANAKTVAETSKTREDFLRCFEVLYEGLRDLDEATLKSARYVVSLGGIDELDRELIEASLAYIGVFRAPVLPPDTYLFFPEVGGPTLEDLQGKVSRQVERIAMGSPWGPLLVVEATGLRFVPGENQES